MNSRGHIKVLVTGLLSAILLFAAISCGVKGKPLPPLQPPPIGGDPDKENKYQKKK